LATATGDEHTLGLSLVELCLRERGWTPMWIGRSAPLVDITNAVARWDVRLVAISASAWSKGPALATLAEEIGHACSADGVQLVFGGLGGWPERPFYGRVIRDFPTFTELLTTLGGGV
jgi:methanogenic corrinoid protein MtbC1